MMGGNPTWFVRAEHANRPHPVTPEGWAITMALGMGIVFAIVAAIAVAFLLPEFWWLSIVIVLVMGVGDAVAFYLIARGRTDMSITVSDYQARQRR